MLPEALHDDEAKKRFVAQINDLSRQSRLQGPRPDGAALLAAIVAENEAECLRLEPDLLEQSEFDAPRRGPSGP